MAAAVRSGRFAARDVVVRGVHLHHYVPGIALLALAGGLAPRDSDRIGVHLAVHAHQPCASLRSWHDKPEPGWPERVAPSARVAPR